MITLVLMLFMREYRARFSTLFISLHKISPYPLPDVCRKCEEMSRFGSLGHDSVGSLSFGIV